MRFFAATAASGLRLWPRHWAILGVVLCGSASSARAQQAYSVPKISVRAFVQSDASVGLLYDITLQNGRAAPLGVIRIETPRRVDRERIAASLDGDGIADIRLPLRGEPCFEVWLGKSAIPPGKHARLRLEFTVEREVL